MTLDSDIQQMAVEVAVDIETYNRMKAALAALLVRIRAQEEALAGMVDDGKVIPTPTGDVYIERSVKGRAWVDKEAVRIEAGEMPDKLRIDTRREVKIKDLERSGLSKAHQVELLELGRKDDNGVEVVVKERFPTVADLRKEFGETNRFVGKPKKTTRVVVAQRDGVGSLVAEESA